MANEFPEATARPWGIYDFEGKVKDYPKTIIVAPTGESVCEVSGGWPQCTLAENEANTQLIVTAVNSYDALREAVEAALKWIEGFRITKPVTVPKEVVCAQLRAALHPQPGEGK